MLFLLFLSFDFYDRLMKTLSTHIYTFNSIPQITCFLLEDAMKQIRAVVTRRRIGNLRKVKAIITISVLSFVRIL